MDDAVSKGGSFVFRAFILRAFILCTFLLYFVHLGYILYFKIIPNRFCQMLNRRVENAYYKGLWCSFEKNI